MTNNQDNRDKPEATSESSQKENTQRSEHPEPKKAERTRLKFKKEDMYEITYDF